MHRLCNARIKSMRALFSIPSAFLHSQTLCAHQHTRTRKADTILFRIAHKHTSVLSLASTALDNGLPFCFHRWITRHGIRMYAARTQYSKIAILQLRACALPFWRGIFHESLSSSAVKAVWRASEMASDANRETEGKCKEKILAASSSFLAFAFSSPCVSFCACDAWQRNAGTELFADAADIDYASSLQAHSETRIGRGNESESRRESNQGVSCTKTGQARCESQID